MTTAGYLPKCSYIMSGIRCTLPFCEKSSQKPLRVISPWPKTAQKWREMVVTPDKYIHIVTWMIDVFKKSEWRLDRNQFLSFINPVASVLSFNVLFTVLPHLSKLEFCFHPEKGYISRVKPCLAFMERRTLWYLMNVYQNKISMGTCNWEVTLPVKYECLPNLDSGQMWGIKTGCPRTS